MRDILETLSPILLICFILALFFVFSGTPDLWDKWRAAAMRHADGGCVQMVP